MTVLLLVVGRNTAFFLFASIFWVRRTRSQVLWNDTFSGGLTSSTRQFVNTFFVDQDVDVSDAVVDVRLPYDRVKINGTDPFTFSSNDVVRGRK